MDMTNETIVDTTTNLDDGQNKCQACGSTDIALNVNNGMLRCNFCRHEQAATNFEKSKTNVRDLEGKTIGSGASSMAASTDDMLTFKCSSCASEVVIDTAASQQARCHWCRNTLSVNQQIPNGAVPDKILPFSIKKDDATNKIDEFVGKRKFFAHGNFKRDFRLENVMGVYLPYMIIDVNAKADFEGEADQVVRRYTMGEGENARRYEDVDTYRVDRRFDLLVENLTVESSAEKLDHRSSNRTNNIVNAIKPFDAENSVAWNANYLTGYTSQKRDLDVGDLQGVVTEQSREIGTVGIHDTLTGNASGTKWRRRDVDFKGKQYHAAYMPVWLYSYQMEDSKDAGMIHYVAVNGRTGKASGSVPLDKRKLLLYSLLIAAATFFLIGLPGLIFYLVMLSRYRNFNARHHYETETTSNVENMQRSETLIRSVKAIDRGPVATPQNQNRNNRNQAGAVAAAVAATSTRRETPATGKTKASARKRDSQKNKAATPTSSSSRLGAAAANAATRTATSSSNAQKAKASTSTRSASSTSSSRTGGVARAAAQAKATKAATSTSRSSSASRPSSTSRSSSSSTSRTSSRSSSSSSSSRRR